MVDTERRTGYLLQIPARVLRGLAVSCIPLRVRAAWLEAQGQRGRDAALALNRLTVEQLIRLLNDHSEHVPDSIVAAQFEEYRHGRSPTLHLYRLVPASLEALQLEPFNQRVQRAVERASLALAAETRQEDVSPRLRGLVVGPFRPLDDWPAALHAGYQVESRLHYIAVDGSAVSTYQLLYGHLWLDQGRAFAAVHAHPAAVGPSLELVLSQALDAPLQLVRVDKQLKRDLRFLLKASCRRIRLFDPDPDRQRFQSVTLADDQDLAQRHYLGWSYQQWEDDFPEMASARYTAQFIQDRETSLSIGSRHGSLTLSGAVSAGELRAWARDTGAQIVAAWRDQEQNYLQGAAAALDHARLWQHPRLEAMPDDLRRVVLALVQALATIQDRRDPRFSTWPLPLAAPELLAATLDNRARELLGQAVNAGGPAPWFTLRLPVTCPVDGCLSVAEYLLCPSCHRNLFALSTTDGGELLLACANARCAGRWSGAFPLSTQCSEEHAIELSGAASTLAQAELFPGPELAVLIQLLLADQAPAYHLDAGRDGLWIRDGRLVYQAARPGYAVRQPGELRIDSGGGAVILAPVNVQGDFTGRDRVPAGPAN